MKCPHCDTPIDEHEANRCLSGWVHVDVMGRKLPDHDWETDTYCDCVPDYSLYIAPAWEVVEKKGYSIWCAGGPGDYVYGAGYWDWEDGKKDLLVYALADTSAEERLSPMSPTAPLAICRAALKGLGE